MDSFRRKVLSESAAMAQLSSMIKAREVYDFILPNCFALNGHK